MLNVFYNEIAAGNLNTDHEARAFLYPGKTDNNTYYKLKHELIKRLINTAHLVDVSNRTRGDDPSSVDKCFSLLSVAQKLHEQKSYDTAKWLYGKVAKIARDEHILPAWMFSLRRLTFYASASGNLKLTDEYYETILQLNNLINKFNICSAAYFRVTARFANTKSKKPEFRSTIKKHLRDIDNIPTTLSTPLFVQQYTILKMSYHTAISDYAPACTIGEEGLLEMKQFDHVSHNISYGIKANLMICYIGSRNFEKAEVLSSVIDKTLTPGTFNWLVSRQSVFLLYMQQGKYEDALLIFNDIQKLVNLKKFPPAIREAWLVNEAYLFILDRSGYLGSERHFKNFRVNRFLNEVPKHSKDKRGANVPILIAHIILLLQKGEIDQVTDRYESLLKYRDRYLTRHNNYRANIFIRLIVELAKVNFDLNRPSAKATKFLQELSTLPVDVLQPNFDQEIIPYEKLYEIMREVVDAQDEEILISRKLPTN